MTKALLFGSIGTLSETSELQRAAFNETFAQRGIDWQWSRDAYQAMLKQAGGRVRIAGFARHQGVPMDDALIAGLHAEKSERFRAMLAQGIAPRSGALDLIAAARSRSWQVGLVSSTARDNVVAVMDGLGGISLETFDVMVTGQDAPAPKPDSAAYRTALERLSCAPGDALALEDSATSLASAVAAGVPCIAVPGANTSDQDYSAALTVVRSLSEIDLDAINL